MIQRKKRQIKHKSSRQSPACTARSREEAKLPGLVCLWPLFFALLRVFLFCLKEKRQVKRKTNKLRKHESAKSHHGAVGCSLQLQL